MNLWFDLKYAWRLLMKSKGYSFMCASVVALSLGLAVWTCELIYSQVLKPLPFPKSSAWYSLQIGTKAESTPHPGVDAYTYQELLKRNRSADYLGAFAEQPVVLSEGQASTRLRGVGISPRLLAATQTPPLMGRIFQESDGKSGAAPVAILSYETWQTHFAGDSNVVGKMTRIDSAPVQIIGVMPKDFLAFRDFELWEPLQMPALARPADSTMTLMPFVIAADKKKVVANLNEMKPAIAGVNHDHPELFDSGRHVALIPAHQMYTHSFAPIVMMMSLLAAAVLLIGGMNIGMVFLARLLERSREIALRNALGASRGRLMRLCLLETALIVLLGLVAGWGLAGLGVRWTQGLYEFGSRIKGTGRPPNLLQLRPADLAAALICALAIWLLSTLVPAWRVVRQDAAEVLAGSGKGTSRPAGNRSVALLVGVQVVVSCLVLVVCTNLVLAVKKEVNKPTGLNTAGVIIATNPTVFDARFAQPAERLRYWEELKTSIESRVPGAAVAFTTEVPTEPGSVPAAIETQQGTTNKGAFKLPATIVSEGYFSMLGLNARSGRLFESTDNSTSLNVAVVDEKLAARYWPDQNALGKRVQLNPTENGPWLAVVGVVSAVSAGPYSSDVGIIYQPLRQALPSGFRLLVRPPSTTSDSRSAIRAAAFAVDRDLPLQNLQTVDDYVASLNIATSALVPAVTAVALITALLAASGLFGLISRSVAQRTQEVGIRRALGASPWRATSRFTRQGAVYLCVAIVGVALGVMVMPLLSRAIDNILDHVLLGTFGVVLLIAGVIFFASYLPSRSAVAMEPGDALRYE
ncbi:MAG TPA: ABC transporter permease [Thermoanaerobaculia bacterium]|nr:ABC transporter permease [Thermoanaerobaculia bacterium]